MSTSTVVTFVSLLRKSQLLTAEQLEEVVRDLQPQFPEAKALARELIRRGWMTPYQINQLSQGRGGDLVLGSYVILERLGEGGMGQVFKARHRSMGRVVALKVLRKERIAHPDALKRFHREIQAAARLSHPNIVMAYDADSVNGNHYFVMEYVEGTDLSNLVKKQGPLSVPKACNYVYQAALGLQHAHEQDMVHRDVKPHNLLLTRDGTTVKILDMGLARLGDPNQDSGTSALTQDGRVVGTPDYIAPEQARNSHTADIRADLYSLGCTFYYILSGQVPFPGGNSVMEKLMKHQTEDPVPIELVSPDVSDEVAAILRKLIRRKPEERFQTPHDLVEALEPLALDGPGSHASINLDATPGPGTSITNVNFATVVEPRTSRRWPWLVGAAAAIVLVGVGLLAIVGRLGRPTPPPAKDPEVAGPPAPPVDKTPPPKVLTPLDRLDATKIPEAIRPLRPLDGLVAVFGEPRGQHWGWGGVQRVLFSADNQLIATASYYGDPYVRIWDAEHLRERAAIRAGVTGAQQFTFWGETHTLVAADHRSVNVWAAADRPPRNFAVPPLSVMVLSPDGKFLVGCLNEQDPKKPKQVNVWDVATGQIVQKRSLPEGIVRHLVLSPNLRRLAAVVWHLQTEKNPISVEVWDLDVEKPHHFEGLAPIPPPQFTPDGKSILLSYNDSLKLTDVDGGKAHWSIPLRPAAPPLPQPLVNPVLSPDGKLLAIAALSDDGSHAKAQFYNVETGKPTATTPDYEGSSSGARFTPDSTIFVTHGMPMLGPPLVSPVRLWNPADGKELPPLKNAQAGLAGIAFAPNGKRLALGGNALRVWDLASREEVRLGERMGPVQFVALAGGQTLWAAGRTGTSQGGVRRHWSLPGTSEAGGPRVGETAWAVDAAHQTLAAAGQSQDPKSPGTIVKLWDAVSGLEKQPQPPVAGPGAVTALALSPGGKTLALATWGVQEGKVRGAVLLRPIGTGKDQALPEVITEPVRVLAFSPDNKFVAALTFQALKLFELSTHKLRDLPKIPGQTTQVLDMAFSPDGSTLATVSSSPVPDSPLVRLWEPGTGKLRRDLPGTGRVAALAFRPDGKELVTAGIDGSVLLWDIATGKVKRHWELPGPVNAFAFSEDGRHLFTGNTNGTVYALHLAGPVVTSR